MAEDLYSILGVARDAAPEAIKKAYRRIAKENHPDVKPGDKVAEERFKRATAAFEVLGDARKRKLYDEFGEDAARIGWDESKAEQLRAYRSARSGAGGSPFGAGAADFDLGEIFGDIFGRAGGAGAAGIPFEELFGAGGRRAGGPQRGEDLTARMTVSLAEAVRGSERSLQVRRPGRCATCQGSGRAGAPSTCPACNGSGRVRRGRGLGSFGGPCPQCGGSGTVAPACPTCAGSGTVEESKRLTVRIPAGVQTGSQVRLAGQGAAGLRGGPPGDLYIEVEVQPHPSVRREGDDLFLDLPVTVPEAVRGGEVRVPTFDGEVTVRVPPASQSGRKLRLRGRGVPSLKGGERGDLYLVLQVRVPEPDAPGVREAVEQLGQAYPRDVRADVQL